MNPLVAHLVSGQILFTGLPLMILLIWGYERITRPDLRRLTLALVWICGVFTLSTAAVPWWAMALLIAGDVTLTHATAHARAAAHEITHGEFRGFFLLLPDAESFDAIFRAVNVS